LVDSRALCQAFVFRLTCHGDHGVPIARWLGLLFLSGQKLFCRKIRDQSGLRNDRKNSEPALDFFVQAHFSAARTIEKQNQQLNEYAHIVSHDLKAPLRGISALLTWTKEDFRDKIGPEGVANIEMMEDKIEKMDCLIENILHYSSIEEDAIVNKQVDLNEVIKDILHIIYVPEHIQIKTVNELPTIYADKTRMQQLFQNLISNAINYNDKENGLIEIDCRNETDRYIFSLKDNGMGIPKEYHQKIFKIFNSVGNHKKSTGIGLSIVKKVIDLYKGEIWLESEVGTGTTFYFSFKK